MASSRRPYLAAFPAAAVMAAVGVADVPPAVAGRVVGTPTAAAADAVDTADTASAASCSRTAAWSAVRGGGTSIAEPPTTGYGPGRSRCRQPPAPARRQPPAAPARRGYRWRRRRGGLLVRRVLAARWDR